MKTPAAAADDDDDDDDETDLNCLAGYEYVEVRAAAAAAAEGSTCFADTAANPGGCVAAADKHCQCAVLLEKAQQQPWHSPRANSTQTLDCSQYRL